MKAQNSIHAGYVSWAFISGIYVPESYVLGQIVILMMWERSRSVVECMTQDREAAVSSLIGVTALCP